MNFTDKIKAFAQLGKILSHFTDEKEWPGFEIGVTKEEFDNYNELINRVRVFNGWFEPYFVRESIKGLTNMLNENSLNKWTSNYNIKEQQKTVAIIMAGNIPMVGFHDLLCVLISGNKAMVKMSSDDDKLLPATLSFLFEIAPDLKEQITFVQKMENFDAVIATGSNNSARYFETYFGKYPNIIRKNRTSVAVLTGEETEEELELLGKDITQYFGLGCRNVSKILVPNGYDMNKVIAGIFPYKHIMDNKKFGNNYDYNKAVFLMGKEELIENGFMLFRESEELFCPISCLYFQGFNNENEIEKYVEENKDQIQCVVSKKHIPFGKAQQPELWDYADGVDTMEFLVRL